MLPRAAPSCRSRVVFSLIPARVLPAPVVKANQAAESWGGLRLSYSISRQEDTMRNIELATPGFQQILGVVRRFYVKAFRDPIIGHFFFQKDHEHLIRMQASFVMSMLGLSEESYRGRPLRLVHKGLPLAHVHFNRRMVLLGEELEKSDIPQAWGRRWLELEERFRPQIVNSSMNCHGG